MSSWRAPGPVNDWLVAKLDAITELIPHARLEVLPTGHGPWLGQPARTAATVMDFLR